MFVKTINKKFYFSNHSKCYTVYGLKIADVRVRIYYVRVCVGISAMV